MRMLLALCLLLTTYSILAQEAVYSAHLRALDDLYKKELEHPGLLFRDHEIITANLTRYSAQKTINDAIIIAAINGYNGFLKILLDSVPLNNPDKQLTDTLEIALLWSSQAGNQDSALLLIEKTDVEGSAQNHRGQTSLIFAKIKGMKKLEKAFEHLIKNNNDRSIPHDVCPRTE